MKKLFAVSFSVICLSVVSFAQTDSTGKDLLGKYLFPDGSVVADVTVSFVDSTLSMTSSAGTSELVKQGVDVYTIIAFQGTAQFKRDSVSKKVTGVIIDAMGYHLEGIRDTATTAATSTTTTFAPIWLRKMNEQTENAIVMMQPNDAILEAKRKQFFLL